MIQGIGAWRGRAAMLLGVGLVVAAAALGVLNTASAQDAMASNGIYDLFVEKDAADAGIGVYTAGTGPSHPVTIGQGDRQSVLYGGDSGYAGTSYTTVRSYTTGTDYVTTEGSPTSANTVINLDQFGSVADLGTTGFETTWALPGGQTTPDPLEIKQIWRVNGTTLENSVIELTTTVRNTSAAGGSVAVGIRHQWDIEMSCDDGPTFTPVDASGDPAGPTYTTEQTFAAPTFPAYRIEDNDCTGSPLFAVFGTAGPSGIMPPPTSPELLMYANWSDAYDAAFEYTTDPTDSEPDSDSAVLYYYGATPNTAANLGPGDSVTVTAALFAGEAGEPPPVLQPTPTPTTEPPEELSPPEEATPAATVVAPETGAGTSADGGSPAWLIAALAGVGLAGAAGYTALRIRARRE